MTTKRWQDWLLLLGGVWLFVAPWTLGSSSDPNSSWNAWTLGVLVLATVWWAQAKPADKTSGWLQALYGVWLFAAPWTLGFSGLTSASWNAWLTRAAIIAVAGWDIADRSSRPVLRPPSSRNDHVTHRSH